MWNRLVNWWTEQRKLGAIPGIIGGLILVGLFAVWTLIPSSPAEPHTLPQEVVEELSAEAGLERQAIAQELLVLVREFEAPIANEEKTFAAAQEVIKEKLLRVEKEVGVGGCELRRQRGDLGFQVFAGAAKIVQRREHATHLTAGQLEFVHLLTELGGARSVCSRRSALGGVLQRRGGFRSRGDHNGRRRREDLH